MARHNITQAANLSGKSRQQLYAMMSKGRISWETGEDGRRYIDTSELERVFGDLTPRTVSDDMSGGHIPTPGIDTPDIEKIRLETELRSAQAMLADLREQLREVREDRDEWRKISQQLALPAPAQPQEAVITTPPPQASIPATEKPAERVSLLRRTKEFIWG